MACTYVRKWTRVSKVECPRCKGLRSIRKPESDAHVQWFRSASGSPGSVCDCTSPDRGAGAGEKIPRPPLEELLESRLCPERQSVCRIFHDLHTAFVAESRHNARSCPSIDKWGFAAGEFEKNRLRHSDHP